MERSLEKVFNPRSIAVIGASEVPGKASERRTRSLIEGGYKRDIYLINPKRSELFGRKAYPSITEVEKEVDLVMVVVAPRFLVQSVADSIKMGAKGIIIITAGLGETGEEGKRIEAEVLDEAAKTGAYIIGPNCSGMFSASAGMNILGVPSIQKGSISVLAQSGNVIDSLTHYAKMKGVGFSKIISVGNAIGVNFHEYIDYLKDDPDTKAIMMYLEGIKEGNSLVRVARETGRKKPVIALKVGKSKAGARAAASHTGSLAGDDVIVDAAFRQAGIVRVSNVDELFDMAEVFSNCPLPKGNRVTILSEGGGDNSVAADNAETYGMEVPVLSEETQEKIRPFLLEGMPASNPIDYGGTAEENPHMITECVNACMQDDNIDGVYITGFFGGFKDIIAPHVAELEEKTSRDLTELVEKYEKPLFVHTSFAREPIKSLDILKSAGVPVIESSERTARCLGEMMKFSVRQKKIADIELSIAETKERDRVKALFKSVKEEKRNNLLETESRELLKEYNVSLPDAMMADSPDKAVDAAGKIGFPVAMKIVSPDIIHKSDAGGIKLGLSSEEEVRDAFDEILKNTGNVTTRDKILGTLISPMVTKGQECIIGMIQDRQFGPVIMFGLGGIFVEVLKDVSFRVAPLAREDIDEMVEEIKGYKVLKGIRGERPKDIDAIKDILFKLSEIAVENPEISEIDLNPVIVHEKGLSVVDSRVILG
ncbi:MAG: acetate--CoA ligase family protein [Thermodesulfobacteriota bacterium]|nr:acetate--CoA ligase family protein [Thermodesulfobacteriota bacterium]